jgi:hypothetical protein
MMSELLKFLAEFAAKLLGEGDALGELIALGAGALDQFPRFSREVNEGVDLVEALGRAPRASRMT